VNSDIGEEGRTKGREGRATSGDARRGGASERGTNDRGTTQEKRERGEERARAAASPLGRSCRVHVLSPDMLVLNELLPTVTFAGCSNDVRM